jgi:hypothetical protein
VSTGSEAASGTQKLESSSPVTVAVHEDSVKKDPSLAVTGAYQKEYSTINEATEHQGASEITGPAPADFEGSVRTDTAVQPEPGSTLKPPETGIATTMGAEPAGNNHNDGKAKPMTSQAKRRAAQARRMRLAYG